MIEKLYSDFDPDITIRSASGKTFPQDVFSFDAVKKVPGVKNISRAIEEVVVLKHEKKWVNASLLAVDSSFLEMSGLISVNAKGDFLHIVDGEPVLNSNGRSFGIIGATLLDKLGGYIPERTGFEQIMVYAPKREAKVRMNSNPFNSDLLSISGRMNFNREVNAAKLVVPIELGSELLDYDKDITSVFVDIDPAFSNDEIKEVLKSLLGPDFNVKTRYEKNELIFKTSKSEKLIVIVILLFIFVLAAFNLVASLTMLFVEKKGNISTMISYGADKKLIFRIFFFEGLLICGKGILFGLVLGYAICNIQIFGELLEMPNSGGEPFPVSISWLDGLFIVIAVSLLSFVFSFLPVKYLLKRNFGNVRF